KEPDEDYADILKITMRNPLNIQKIVNRDLNLTSKFGPDKHGLHAAITYLAEATAKRENERLMNEIANVTSIDGLKEAIDTNSRLIDAIEHLGKTDALMSELYKLSRMTENLSAIYEGKFQNWEEYPLLSNPLLQNTVINLVIRDEGKRREVFQQSVNDALTIDELLKTISLYSGIPDRFTLIESIELFAKNKKNAQYIADGGTVDWQKFGIAEDYGIKDKLIGLIKSTHLSRSTQDPSAKIMQVNADEWPKAENLFEQNNHLAKLDKKRFELGHSFIK
ncbi:MAG TPA: hypothetical protein PLD88_09315, partial [Candidatus Berkiella sp.]|nr:hypothetical protein [Candidatus Berkiella sp.]